MASCYRRLITHVPDRPAHDRRCATGCAPRIQDELGWTPKETFETGIRKTIQWYLDHQGWVDELVSQRSATARRGMLL